MQEPMLAPQQRGTHSRPYEVRGRVSEHQARRRDSRLALHQAIARYHASTPKQCRSSSLPLALTVAESPARDQRGPAMLHFRDPVNHLSLGPLSSTSLRDMLPPCVDARRNAKLLFLVNDGLARL